MVEVLQSGTISTAAGNVTYKITNTEISVTYSDGVTTTMPNISHDYNLQTNVMTPTSEILISGNKDQFHVNQNVVNVTTDYGHAQSLYSGSGGLRHLSTFSIASEAHKWLSENVTVEDVYAAIRDNPGPNGINEFNQQVEDYQVSLLLNRMPAGLVIDPANFGDWGNNPVYHRLFEDQNVLINVTLPGHQFHGKDMINEDGMPPVEFIGRDADGGVVFRRAMEMPDGSLKIISIGLGTGPDAGWNNFLAPILWDVNGARVGENAGAYALNQRAPWFVLADKDEAIAALNRSLDEDGYTVEEALELSQKMNPQLRFELNEIISLSDGSCFSGEVPIDMWPLDPALKPNSDGIYDQDEVRRKIWKKPIELIEVGDVVVSFDKVGNLVPGYIPRTFQKEVKIVLNFFGTHVTPGHVYYRADSKRSNKFETLIDILRDDGVIQKQDGTLIRAATNVPVNDPRDNFVKAITGKRRADGSLQDKDEGRIRLGTRFIVGGSDQRKSWSVADLIDHAGGVVGDDELIRVGDGPPMPFHWEFSDTLPKPEDFVLEASATTLNDIYKASEWENHSPRMPGPMVMDGGPVQPLSNIALKAMSRNEPIEVENGIATAEASPINQDLVAHDPRTKQ